MALRFFIHLEAPQPREHTKLRISQTNTSPFPLWLWFRAPKKSDMSARPNSSSILFFTHNAPSATNICEHKTKYHIIAANAADPPSYNAHSDARCGICCAAVVVKWFIARLAPNTHCMLYTRI